MKPLSTARDFVKRAVGIEPEPQKEPKKILHALDSTIEKMRMGKKERASIFSFGSHRDNDDSKADANESEPITK